MAKPVQDAAPSSALSGDRFLRMYRDLRAAVVPMENAIADYRNVRKRMKKEGVDMTALAMMESLAKLDEAEATLRLRNLMRYAGWANLPIGAQADLFGTSDDSKPTNSATQALREQEAENNGHRAGRNGDKFDTNPHEPGAAEHAAWARGWNAGQERAVHEDLGGKPAAAPATPRRKRTPAAETRAGL